MVAIESISSLGTVLTESQALKNNLFQATRPVFDSGGVIDSSYNSLVNFMGKTREITISGFFEGSTTEINSFITEMENWTNKGRQEARVYTSTYGSQKSVFCDDFTWTKSHTKPYIIDYSIKLLEGSTLGFFTGS